MQGTIIKDDERYSFTENYLKEKGHSFCEPAAPPGGLDFIIFPFMGEVAAHTYDDGYFAGLKKSVRIFSGVYSPYLREVCGKYRLSYYVMAEDEAVKVKNAVATSEGVLAYLITKRSDTIANSRVLIIGYGVCGRDLAKRLKGLGANAAALVRNREKQAAAYADSVKPVYLDELFKEQGFPFDIVINTVPATVFTNEMTAKTGGALLIDIASRPYGFDMDYAKTFNESSALLSGIPGKYAKRRSGEILGEYIDSVLRKE